GPLVAVELAGADDDEPAIRYRPLHADERANQEAQALALLRASHKEDVALAVTELRQRLQLAREVLDVHPVGDHVVVARKVLLDVLHGRRRYCDFAVELCDPASDEPAAV